MQPSPTCLTSNPDCPLTLPSFQNRNVSLNQHNRPRGLPLFSYTEEPVITNPKYMLVYSD